MGKFKDLTGKRFGKLIVIKRVEVPKGKIKKGIYWLCKCDCGNKKIANSAYLLRGNTNSCGCSIHLPSANFIDLTGKRFGRLVVIKRVYNPERKTQKGVYWLCKCDCGNEKIIHREHLQRGSSTSCGCYNKEKVSLPFNEASANILFLRYKTNCKKKDTVFELSRDEFLKLTKENCFYCGKLPSQIIKARHNRGDYIYNGIDRIDSTEGYTIENAVPCCWRCNEAKMSETQSDFFEWIKTVHGNLSNKGLI